MNIDVFSICYNEQRLMPFFMRHYSFARNIYIYDNHSSDNSRAIAHNMGAKVKTFGTAQLDDREYLKIKNTVYKTSDADYVIVCDLDEFLYHPNLLNYLEELKQKGIQLPEIQGYNIYSENWPIDNILEIDTGFYDLNFSKQIIFSPKVDIKFNYGCHTNAAQGRRGGQMYALHYRCMGGVTEMIARHQMYSGRMCEFNKSHKLGGHYFRTPEQLKLEWNKNINKAKKLVFLTNEI